MVYVTVCPSLLPSDYFITDKQKVTALTESEWLPHAVLTDVLLVYNNVFHGIMLLYVYY